MQNLVGFSLPELDELLPLEAKICCTLSRITGDKYWMLGGIQKRTKQTEEAEFVFEETNLTPRQLLEQRDALRDSLSEILGYSGGADNALEDEYVMNRAQAALAKHGEESQ